MMERSHMKLFTHVMEMCKAHENCTDQIETDQFILNTIFSDLEEKHKDDDTTDDLNSAMETATNDFKDAYKKQVRYSDFYLNLHEKKTNQVIGCNTSSNGNETLRVLCLSKFDKINDYNLVVEIY